MIPGFACRSFSLRWRHNGHDSVLNHQPHDCLLNRLVRRKSKKTSKLCVTGLCARNSPGTGEFPAQMASNAENVSIWWRHHVVASVPFININDTHFCKGNDLWGHSLDICATLKSRSNTRKDHDDVIKWKHFPCYWPFVRGVHRSPVLPLTNASDGAFDVFYDMRLNKRLSKQSWGWWFETPLRPYDVTVMIFFQLFETSNLCVFTTVLRNWSSWRWYGHVSISRMMWRGVVVWFELIKLPQSQF